MPIHEKEQARSSESIRSAADFGSLPQGGTSSYRLLDPEVEREDIQRRAYEIYLERGGGLGRELEDWLQAEREVRERVRMAA